MVFSHELWSTAELLQEVIPINSPLHASTLREHVCSVAQRMENELGEEQWSFIEGCARPEQAATARWSADGGHRWRLRAWPQQRRTSRALCLRSCGREGTVCITVSIT
jgi:hypothetical protein